MIFSAKSLPVSPHFCPSHRHRINNGKQSGRRNGNLGTEFLPAVLANKHRRKIFGRHRIFLAHIFRICPNANQVALRKCSMMQADNLQLFPIRLRTGIRAKNQQNPIPPTQAIQILGIQHNRCETEQESSLYISHTVSFELGTTNRRIGWLTARTGIFNFRFFVPRPLATFAASKFAPQKTAHVSHSLSRHPYNGLIAYHRNRQKPWPHSRRV